MAKKTNRKKQQAAEKRPSHEFKPGNRWRFRPGVSGNPEGRGVEHHKESWRDFLAEIANPKIPKTRLRVLQELSFRKACQGSFKHLELCIDRGWGRPHVHVESVNLNGNLADVIKEARARVENWTPPQLPEVIEAAPEKAAPETAPEASRPQRVIAADVEQADHEPQSVMEALNRSTRESRQINVEPSFGSWRH